MRNSAINRRREAVIGASKYFEELYAKKDLEISRYLQALQNLNRACRDYVDAINERDLKDG